MSYVCPECGRWYAQPDGECIYECTSPRVLASVEFIGPGCWRWTAGDREGITATETQARAQIASVAPTEATR